MPTPAQGHGHAAVDQSTVAMFQADWDTYRKLVENNFLSHREAYATLHRELLRHYPHPFHFLDIACGDASASAAAVRGTAVRAYTGIDLSALALDLATGNLAHLGCSVTLVEHDFIDAIAEPDDPVDVAWIGLSLHHLRTGEKLDFMRRVRALLAPGGRLMVYENTSLDGEDRDAWLERWDRQRPDWHAYTDLEWSRLAAHVHAADFPETVSGWRALGHEAGFTTIEDLYTTPTDLFRLWSFNTA